ELLEAGQIDEVSKGKYLFKPSKDYFVGVMDITSSGKGYVMVEDLDEDILIKNKNLNKSFDGDTVRVYQFRRRNNGKREGEVVEIIKRKRTDFVGIIELHDHFAFVRTTNYNMYTDIFVPKDRIKDAKNGQVVLVSMDDWPDKGESPYGTVKKVLGYAGKKDTDIHTNLER